MIITILVALILIILLGFPIVDYVKNRETMLFGLYISVIPILTIYAIVLSSSYKSPDVKTINGLTYKELSYMAEHYDELSIDGKVEVSHNVKKWNSSLNSHNDYWQRFTIADYSSYVITIENEIEL